uniref:Putative secreted protein n=1 Tax=Panstrongylus lignarius TaxID=156445 RepID=A0A224XYM5_9HEMI
MVLVTQAVTIIALIARSTGTISIPTSPLHLSVLNTPVPAPHATPITPFKLSSHPGSGSTKLPVTTEGRSITTGRLSLVCWSIVSATDFVKVYVLGWTVTILSRNRFSKFPSRSAISTNVLQSYCCGYSTSSILSSLNFGVEYAVDTYWKHSSFFIDFARSKSSLVPLTFSRTALDKGSSNLTHAAA